MTWASDVERIISGDLGDLASLSLNDLRSQRDECRAVEDKVSYLRRLVQGRSDIVAADLQRRSEGSTPADMGALVDQLPSILSDRTPPVGPGRLPASLAPPDDDGALTAELDQVAPAGVLVDLAHESEEAVRELAERLSRLERDVSGARRALFDRIDAYQGELARRYKIGEASVGSVLDDI